MPENLTEKYEAIERTREEERRRECHAAVAECAENLFALAEELGQAITIEVSFAEYKRVSIQYNKARC